MRLAFLGRVGALILLAVGPTSSAQPAPPRIADACAAFAGEAAARSGLTVDIVLRVMMAESGDNPRIVSPKGAMGCMQIMPRTWRDLSARYALGTDPFDVRRNMIGGALYLAELIARYGPGGAVAAYNAGPGRYERYLSGTARLPAETVAYVRRIGTTQSRPVVVTAAARWQEAGLFLAQDAAPKTESAATIEDRAPPMQNVDRLFPLARRSQAQGAFTATP